MSTPVNDRDLDEYLRRDSTLSREYRNLGDDPPPTELQKAVLERAQEAIEREKLLRKRPPLRRWVPVFALAATIVLACAVLLDIGLHQYRLLPGTAVPSSETESADGVTIVLNSPAEAPPPEAAAVQETPAKVSPEPQRKHPERTDQRDELAMKQESSGTVASTRKPAAPPPAPAAQVQTEERKQAEKLDSVTAITSIRHLRTPEEWRAAIDDLKNQGKQKEAEQEIAAFRKAYPEMALPGEERGK